MVTTLSNRKYNASNMLDDDPLTKPTDPPEKETYNVSITSGGNTQSRTVDGNGKEVEGGSSSPVVSTGGDKAEEPVKEPTATGGTSTSSRYPMSGKDLTLSADMGQAVKDRNTGMGGAMGELNNAVKESDGWVVPQNQVNSLDDWDAYNNGKITSYDLEAVDSDLQAYENPYVKQMEEMQNKQLESNEKFLEDYANMVIPPEKLERREKRARQIQGIQNLGNLLAAFGNLYHTRGGAPSQTIPETTNKDMQTWRDRQAQNLQKYVDLQARLGNYNMQNMNRLVTAANTSAKIQADIEKAREEANKTRATINEINQKILSGQYKDEREKEKANAYVAWMKEHAAAEEAKAEYQKALAERQESLKALDRAKAALAKAQGDAARTKAAAALKDAETRARKAREDAANAGMKARATSYRDTQAGNLYKDKYENPEKYRSSNSGGGFVPVQPSYGSSGSSSGSGGTKSVKVGSNGKGTISR